VANGRIASAANVACQRTERTSGRRRPRSRSRQPTADNKTVALGCATSVSDASTINGDAAVLTYFKSDLRQGRMPSPCDVLAEEQVLVSFDQVWQ
jgi:hypothetical protein